MIYDSLNTFATAQSSTVSVASTDQIDTLAAGTDYAGSWFVFQVSTTFTQIGTLSTATVQVQTSDTSTFQSTVNSVTLTQSANFLTASLAAGKAWFVRIPPGAKRYLRGYVSVANTNGANAFSAGAWNMFIAKDIDLEINRRRMIQ